MSDKALSSAALEFTQRIQRHFPPGISARTLGAWNGVPGDDLEAVLLKVFGEAPQKKDQPKPQLPPLLVALNPVTVPDTPVFNVAEHIKRDVSRNAKPRIRYVDQSVLNDINGLVEPAQPAQILYPHRTSRNFEYPEARKELGGDQIVKTTWAKLFWLVERQPDGPGSGDGTLLTDGRANLFEIPNVNGVPRLVRVSWHDWYDGHGWHFLSFSVDYRREWREGRQVFSGNPLPVVPTEA